MRDIKFRAWEKFDDEWAADLGNSGEMHYTKTWPDEELQEKRTVVLSGFYHDSGWSSDTFTVMQFTGLYDKNGKEIWEGDIVKFRDECAEVVWYAMSSRFGAYFPNWGHYFEDETFLEKQIVEIEVVGNVWENPDIPIIGYVSRI